MQALNELEILAGGADGHKFGVPDLPLPPRNNLKFRYDPIVTQVTKLMMRDGKLSVAQRVGSSVLFRGVWTFADPS
jgi:hypothetical protein